MGSHGMFVNNMHISYMTKDAVFRTLDNQPIVLEFHRYCGPMFTIDDNDPGGFMPKEGTPEWDDLWRQFDGWWSAKGKAIYHSHN